MAYTPNPLDATNPLDVIDASTAAAEFRALKASITSRIDAIVAGAATYSLVKQTAITGVTDVNSNPALLEAGTGFNVTRKATNAYAAGNRAAVFSFASGFTSSGEVNFIENTAATDTVGFWTGMGLWSKFYAYITRVSAGVLSGGQSLAPPLWGDSYDRNQCLLQFGGANLSTSFIDDFGASWVRTGAVVQTTQFKFGTGAMGGSGASNSLSGLEGITSTAPFDNLGPENFAMRGWVRLVTLPAAAEIQTIVHVGNAGGFGVRFGCYNNAGTIRWAYWVSSDGTTWNIANAVQGTSLPVVNQWYFIEFCRHTSFTSGYRLFVDGVSEATTVSGVSPCFPNTVGIGKNCTGASDGIKGYLDKVEILPYADHPGNAAYAVPTAAPSVATTNYASDWFDTRAQVMKRISGASLVAFDLPVFTSVNRLYVGEIVSQAAGIGSVVSYAYNRKYESPWARILSGSAVNIQFTHNIGLVPNNFILKARCRTPELGYLAGEEITLMGASATITGSPVPWKMDKKILQYRGGNVAAPWATYNWTTGANTVLTLANWEYKALCSYLPQF